MRTSRTSFLLALALVCVTSRPLPATTLIGTQVSGALYFSTWPANYFDPANHLVPAGYLNAAGATVTISSDAVEFGCFDGTATITANFTATQLIITDTPVNTFTYNSIQSYFTNLAFTNLYAVSDTFPSGGVTGSLSGNVITLNWAGGQLTGNQTVQVVFNVNLPAAPTLDIQPTPTNSVVISWPAASSGFNLQQNTNLISTNWVSVTNSPVVINGLNEVIVSPPLGTRFYRLSYP
jgi:hypothetical protein